MEYEKWKQEIAEDGQGICRSLSYFYFDKPKLGILQIILSFLTAATTEGEEDKKASIPTKQMKQPTLAAIDRKSDV